MIAIAASLYLALFALAASMARHGPVLLGHRYLARRARFARLAGGLLLGASFAMVFATPDWSMALIDWCGLAPLLGGTVLLGLTYGAPIARGGAVVALLGLLVGGVAGV